MTAATTARKTNVVNIADLATAKTRRSPARNTGNHAVVSRPVPIASENGADGKDALAGERVFDVRTVSRHATLAMRCRHCVLTSDDYVPF